MNKNNIENNLYLSDMSIITSLGFEMFKSKYGFIGIKKTRLRKWK